MAATSSVEVDSQDVIRLVLQFLQESNLTRSMHTLQHETGVSLNSVESVDGFKADVVGGRWDRVLSQVRKMLGENENLQLPSTHFDLLADRFHQVKPD
jgi:WD40 repeat-containing protein SMU1